MSKDDAEKIAVQLVKKELEALDVLCNSPKDPPTFVVEKAREIDSFSDFIVPGKGFTFFQDEAKVSGDRLNLPTDCGRSN